MGLQNHWDTPTRSVFWKERLGQAPLGNPRLAAPSLELPHVSGGPAAMGGQPVSGGLFPVAVANGFLDETLLHGPCHSEPCVSRLRA